MNFRKYYQDELAYLHEMGRVFARENPRLAGFLARDTSDPDVERLLEAFAFLTGRLRQRLEAEMPEVAHGLLQLVWPHYLRPIPPITMMRFRHAERSSEQRIDIKKGTTVQSGRIDGERVVFQTSYDTVVLPYSVTLAELDNRADTSSLRLVFDQPGAGGLAPLAAAPLRLFLNGQNDPVLARDFYLYFLRYTRAIHVSAGANLRFTLGPQSIQPVGFSRTEDVIPYPDGAFTGFRLMQEYFTCPEKFMFVDLRGLECLAGQSGNDFTVTFEFNRRFPRHVRLSPETFLTNTTPAINLFPSEGRAIQIAHERTEYPVRPIAVASQQSVHSIEAVTGWMQGTGKQVIYEKFENFRHDLDEDDDSGKLYFKTYIRPAIGGRGVDYYISFVTRLSEIGQPQTETISMRLLCSNGVLAEKVRAGDVREATSSTPSKIQFSNVTAVLPEVPPPLDDSILWTLIANLARNFASVVDIEALKTVLAAYDFRAAVDQKEARFREVLLNSFKSFTRQDIDIFIKGRPIRAHELILQLAESSIGGEGEMFLFGMVLDQFLRSYASINSLHRFKILGLDQRVVHEWPVRYGEAQPL